MTSNNTPWKNIFTIAVATLMLSAMQSGAWCALAHYLITMHRIGAHDTPPLDQAIQTPSEIAQYANLPDAWDSNTDPDWGLSIDITPYFCWSHGVRSNGLVDLSMNPVEIPKVPSYHPDFQNIQPGTVMSKLLDGKTDLSRRWQSNEATVREHLSKACAGFTMHNEEDQPPVHWSYFLGATGSELSNTEAQGKWTIQHGLKEHWAEYILLATQVLHKFQLERTDFDSGGNIIFPQGVIAPTLAIDGLNANNYNNDKIDSLAWLMHLAQAVYNKNRTSRSVDEASEFGLDVQDTDTIRKLLKKQDKFLRSYFTQRHWAAWEGEAYGMNTHMNFQGGSLTVTRLDGTSVTMDYDTPDNLWIEWQMLSYLEDELYSNDWNRAQLHSKAGLLDINPTP